MGDLEFLTCDPLIYVMNPPKNIVPNQLENSISIQIVNMGHRLVKTFDTLKLRTPKFIAENNF